MRIFQSTLLSIALLFVSFSVSALNGIPNTMSVGGKNLVLNGAGTRTKFIISVYHAGLYLPTKSGDANKIMAANEPMALRMKVVSGFASAAKMKHALNQGFLPMQQAGRQPQSSHRLINY